MRGRLILLISTVAAMVLMAPAAQAFAETVTVTVSGTGVGEVSSSEGLAAFNPPESFPPAYKGEPLPISCSYTSPGPQTGNCSNELEDLEEGYSATALVAIPASGSEFAGWTTAGGVQLGNLFEGCQSEEGVGGPAANWLQCFAYSLNGSGENVAVTAMFNIEAPSTPEFPLTITTLGSGTGSVGCSVEAGPAEPCAAEYEEGTEVELIASEGANSEFVEWTGDCSGAGSCLVTMAAPHSVGAVFDLESISNPSTLIVFKGGNGGGTVTSSPTGISCGTEPCEADFAEGSTIELTETPSSGSVFAGWLGCRRTGATSCTVTLTGSEAEVTAVFLTEGQQGQPGSPGPVGPSGPAGPGGQSGSPGPTGPVGLTGATGAQGASGAQGAAGPQGLAGQAGAQGPEGKQGPAGNVKVTCTVNGSKKVTCTVKQAKTASALRLLWSLHRDGRTVSHGLTSAGRLQQILNGLRPGHYMLRIAGQDGTTRIAIG
jgi:hypothetical protein